MIKPHIGIIKPECKEYYKRMDKSTFGGFSEIAGTYDILKDMGYRTTLVINYSNLNQYDILIIFPSSTTNIDCLDTIKKYNGCKIQVITDLNLKFSRKQIGMFYELTQYPSPSHFPFYLLCLKYIKPWSNKVYLESADIKKTINFIYAGGTRNNKRDKYYEEYLHPDNNYITALFTSSKIFGKHKKIKPKVPFFHLQSTYKKTKYSIVMADPDYNDKAMLTQRYFEYIANGVIAFIDNDYDSNNVIRKHRDFRDIRSNAELKRKITILNRQKSVYLKVLSEQQQEYQYYKQFVKSNTFKRILITLIHNKWTQFLKKNKKRRKVYKFKRYSI